MNCFYKGTRIPDRAPVTFSQQAQTLAAGETLLCAEEIDNKKNAVLSAAAFFDRFDSLTVAHGYGMNYGSWCVVDGTHVTTYYGTNATQMSQAAHGLAITDFLAVTIRQKTVTDAVITVQTAAGRFTTTVSHWHASNGGVLLFGAQDMADVKLSCALPDAAHDVFVFVDSYGTAGDAARWPRQLADMGYDRFLLCGHGGAKSASVYPQFERLLALAQPKVCVWMLGMNDPDSASAVNAAWKTHAERFIAACAARGVTPVLATIPNVPSYRHTFKNDWIRNSGCRYVDTAKAVGAETAGSTWYDGMLNRVNDDVHPTARGAQAIAARILLDVPEIV